MKIALFVHCFFPRHYHGTETYTLLIAKTLLELGHDPVIVSAIAPQEQKTESLISEYQYQGLPVYCIDKNQLKPESFEDSYYQAKMLDIHSNLLREIAPDIVHVTHLVNHTAALLDAAKSLQIPIVATLTDFFGICLNSKLQAVNDSLCAGPSAQRTNCFGCYLKGGYLRARMGLRERELSKYATAIGIACSLFNWAHRVPLVRRLRLSRNLQSIKRRPNILVQCYAGCRAIIAPTRLLKTAYERNGFASLPVHHLTFGIDIDRRPKDVPPLTAPIKFGFIGQIAPHKGTEILLEAFCRLPIGTSELLIYGAETQFPEYFHSLKTRSATHPVYFLGTFPPSEIRNKLDEIDCLVIPSVWYENGPLVLLSALASHTPVIVSDVEGLTEFVVEGQNGFKFARGSIDALETVMRQVVEDPARFRLLRSSTNYEKTVIAMTREVEQIYESAMGGD